MATVLLARIGAWTLVAAVTASVLVVGRDRWRERRHRIPRRLAALAVLTTQPVRLPPQVEAVALSSMLAPGGTLERAGDRLRSGASLHRWSAGAETIALAEAVIDMHHWLSSDVAPRRWWPLAAWSALTAALTVGVAVTGSVWLALFFVASASMTVAVLVDVRHDRQWMPHLLASLAAAPSERLCLGDVLHDARGRESATIDQAQQLIRSWKLDGRVRRQAIAVLEAHRTSWSGSGTHRWKVSAQTTVGAVAGIATWMVPL